MSLLASITLGVPWVDEYLALRSEVDGYAELQTELIQIQSRGARLDEVEQKLHDQLDDMVKRSVSPETIDQVRESLINIVRNNGGRLRNLDINRGTERPWATQNDTPMRDTMPEFAEESDFVLHQMDVELRADGSLDAIKKILRDINQQHWFMTTRAMTVLPTAQSESPVALEVRLVCYGLTRKPVTPDDPTEFAMDVRTPDASPPRYR